MKNHPVQARGRGSRARRLAVVGLATVAMAAGSVAVASQSEAAGLNLLGTTTTVTATPSTAGLYRNIHLVATVKLNGLPALGVVPTGTVTFRSTDAYTDVADIIGTAKLSFCLFTACTAYVDTTRFFEGSDSYTATYSGDSISKPSATTGSVTVTENLGDYASYSSVTCIKGSESCDAGLITDHLGTWLETFTSDTVGATSNHTVAEQVGLGTLGCASTAPGGAGALATFIDTPSIQSYKSAYYTVTDPTKAANLAAELTAHPNYLGCYASDVVFTNGQTMAPAVQNPSDGNLFEGPLAYCGSVSFDEVCFVASPDTDQYGNSVPGDFQVEIRWGFGTPSDPKYIG